MVLQGRFGLTAGDVAAFGAVLATTYKPIKNASKGFGRLMEQLASGERLMEVLDAEEERADPRDATPIERLQSQIRFEDVTLVHAGRGERREVIRGLDLTLRRGEVVAVVGRTGSGKTSLVDLTIGLYPPTRGRISIDERPLQEIASRSWRDRIAVVEQDAFLFDTSIAENIRYGLPDASDDAVLAAARAAHVDEFVDALPAGFDTEVGEFGLRLSGGQRQRIAIARALLRQPDVLIFDEATSALDPKTERTVQEAIAQLRGDRLILMVSHRLASVRDADRILVMEDGRIVEDGPHQALLERSELYRELARA
ncbi:MAG: ABC transporter ATP-binding protein [Actinomycetota bacterium]